jgi:outer membrane protein assembly factor BamE
MKTKYLAIGLLIGSLLLGGCSLFRPYRTPIDQGRKVSDSTLAQIKPGLKKTQIIYLLGTPNVSDPFNKDTWYYVYTYEANYMPRTQYNLVLHFDKQGKLDQVSGNYPSPGKLQQTLVQSTGSSH